MAIVAENKTWCWDFIQPWWNQLHRDLAFINEEFNDMAALDLWKSLGYTQARFTGDMYDMRNAQPQWIEPFREIFAWQHFSWSVYRMTPGTVLPNHRDTYSRFKNIYGIDDTNQICRAIVYLEDWQSGHYGEIDGTPLINWRAGHWVAWRGDTQHLAANNGMTDRYTLQITGIPYENIFLQ